VVVFAGGQRPVSLGTLIRVRIAVAEPERLERRAEFPHFPDEGAVGWYLFLAELNVNDDRDKLKPVKDGYTIRLLVGATDGAARSFEVDIAWDGNPSLSPEEVLASALEHLAVREV
jgi:hypothetical protein